MHTFFLIHLYGGIHLYQYFAPSIPTKHSYYSFWMNRFKADILFLTVMLSHHRRWHWFWSEHKCTCKPTHTCWCCRMPPLSLQTLQVSRARPLLLQSHKHVENVPLGHESCHLRGFGCWRLHQATQSMSQKHILILKTVLARLKRCLWLSPDLLSLPRVYLKTGKCINANLHQLLCSLYWCWPRGNLLLLPLEPEILFHPSTGVLPLQQGWAYIQ